MTYKNILAISPHADDIELGCGASIHRFISEGSVVTNLCFSYPPNVPKDIITKEHLTAMKSLGVTKIITYNFDPQALPPEEVRHILHDYNKEFQPDLVLTTNSKDNHQSHEVVHQESKRIFKHTNLWGYELPWNSFGFDNQAYTAVTSGNLDAKSQAIDSYSSQLNRPFFNRPIVKELAAVRGIQINKPFAEAFEVIRMVIL